MDINSRVQELLDRIDKLEYENAKILAQNKELTAQNKSLTQRVKDLEARLNLDSTNSGKPPSSDGLRKPVSLRKAGGKIGGPEGHKGHTLSYSDNPTKINVIKTHSCHECNQNLEQEDVYDVEKRQVFDIPKIQFEITEYVLEKKKCSNCGTICSDAFPEGVNARTQYGPGVGTLTTYLSVQHHIPLNRIQEIIEDLTDHKISEATLIKQQEKIAYNLEGFEQEVRTKLLTSDYIHADETGSRVEGKTKWLHVNSTDDYTLYNLSDKRGRIGIEEMGIIPQYKGIVVHDCYSSYFKDEYKIEHALCGAHLLRECKSILDNDTHEWAKKMMSLLYIICRLSTKAKDETTKEIYERISKLYDKIVKQGYQEAPYNPGCGKRGKPKQTTAYNLISRLEKNKLGVLLCIKKASVPFTNNRAEQDIRMVKVKQKVSGSFRTEQGAKIFYRIRGVISTLKKQGRNVFGSLAEAVKGKLALF